MSNAFYEQGSQLLTAGAFEFVLDSELKRAVRSQNFLTLIVLETSREWEGMTVTADDGMVQEVAQIITREVRDTDLIGLTERGVLSLVLIDADFEHSTHVIDRLVSRIDSYDFPTPLRIAVGAGAEMRSTLGIAVFSGMLGVTLFGIFLTPVFYYLVVRLTGSKVAPAAAGASH